MARRRKRIVTALGLGLLVVAADQASKLAVRSALAVGESRELVLGLDLHRVNNDGVAFGLFGGGGGPGALVLTAIGVAGLAAVGWYLLMAPTRGSLIAAALIAGGAAGNVIDRIALGSVTDFIDPPRWPAFNLADAAITVGVAILVAGLISEEIANRRAGPAPG